MRPVTSVITNWVQVKLSVARSAVETFSARLEALGALAVTYEAAEDAAEPVFNEPDVSASQLWDNVRLTGLFSSATDPIPIVQALQETSPEIYAIAVEGLPERDWSRVWMDRFVPIQFGERLWIVPSWCVPPEPNAVSVFIDPGMAFGTGTHATTALCLDWLAREESLLQATFIDYGCGSGILAIAAAKLGARQVHGIDIDPQALAVATENASKNHVAIDFQLPPNAPWCEADLLVANILLDPLLRLAPTLARWIRPRGRIALSGLLVSQLDCCAHAFSPWFEIEKRFERDGWGLLIGVRHSTTITAALMPTEDSKETL